MQEERKLFVGGLPWQTREDDLRGHFAQYGEVVHTRVVLDLENGRSRGFGFVEFADEAAARRALAEEEKPNHVFRGCKVDVKRAERRRLYKQTEQSVHLHNSNQDKNGISHKNQFIHQKKLFVGGLHENTTEKDFISYFGKFGTITDVVLMRHRITNVPRGFGFISFDSNEAVCKVLQDRFHNLNGMDAEVKIAIPKSPNYSEAEDHCRKMLNTSPISYFDGIYPPYPSQYYPVVAPLHPYFHAQYTFEGYTTPIMATQGAQMLYSGYGRPTGHYDNLVGSDLSSSVP